MTLSLCIFFIRKKNSQGHRIIITIAREKQNSQLQCKEIKFLVIKEMMTNRVKNKKKKTQNKKESTNRNDFSTVTQSILEYVLIQAFRMG